MTDQPKKRARLTGDQRMAVVIEKQEREVARLHAKWDAAEAIATVTGEAYRSAAKQLERFKAAAELES